VLFFMGKTLNILSMMGLMLGVGMLVDNAVVVLESIDRRYRDGVPARRAALEGSQGVLLAVISATLTSVIVFLPLIVGGRSELTTWLQEVGIAISVALLCSLFSSLTLIPLMSTYILRKRDAATPVATPWLEKKYLKMLGWTLRHKAWTFAILVGGLVLGVVPFAAELVDTAQFAAARNRRLFLNYEFSDFVYKSEAERAVDQVEEYIFAHEDEFQVRSVYSYYGENDAGTVINLVREDLGDEAVRDLRKKIRAGLPEVAGARIFFEEDVEMGGDSTYFALKFYGADNQTLQGLAGRAEAILEGTPGIEDISSSFTKARKEIQVRIDRAKARLYGLTAQDISDIFAFTLSGLRLRRFNTGEREVETWVALRLEDRRSLEDLQQLAIGTEDGRSLRLGDIARFEIVRSPQEIVREDRKIRVALTATYEGENWGEVREELERKVDALGLPPGTSWSWDDRILEQDDQNREMGINFLLALLLVYIVMASLFESVTQPLAILFSIPFAIPGAAWLLVATGTPFNLMSQIGLLILMGIVVNNGIVLLDHLNFLRRSGMPRDEAILRAGRDRLRPILMTATTTVMGLVPLAVGSSGVGGLYYYPLARTVVGGLLSSTVLTLVVLPYMNLGVETAAAWLGRVWDFSSARPVPAPHRT
jgi:HAE1 family hydrophobic/amphiphilic exporter-1